ncbi:MAG TPA: hypothetical protein VFK66_04940 [Oryzihumus sp.]|nr:hypothetical protein [Oryzihumus sp.]
MLWVFIGVAALFLVLAVVLRGNRSGSRDDLGSDVIDYDYMARRGGGVGPGGGFGGL